MAVVELAGAVADPDHVARGRVPVAGRRIHARKGLLVAEQQRLVAGVEIGGAQLRVAFQIEPAGAHEVQRFRNAVGQFLVAPRLRGILEEAQHPLMHAAEIGKAAGGECAQQVQRRGRLPVGHQLALRIGGARRRRERDVVDDVAAVARQLDAIDLFGRRGARFGELPGDAADLHHRHRAGVGQHHRHLQQHAEEVADVVGAVLGETLGAVAALKQEGLAGRNPGERLLEVAGFPCKNQWRKRRKLRLDIRQRLGVWIVGDLQYRPGPPAVGGPPLGHDVNSSNKNRYLPAFAKASAEQHWKWRGRVGSSGAPVYTQAQHGPPVGIPYRRASPCGKSRIRICWADRANPGQRAVGSGCAGRRIH